MPSIPATIAAFLRAIQARNAAALNAAFSDDAIVKSGGEEYQGEALRAWIKSRLEDLEVSVYPVGSARHGADTVVTVMSRVDRVAGDPGVLRQASWRFTIKADRISVLSVLRDEAFSLPAPVIAYIEATNTGDLDALTAVFADDALVNDQLHDYWGKAEIREWARRDIVAERFRMSVVKVVEHYGHIIVRAHVDGDYDKRGLPDPLVMAFYFSTFPDKIVQLFILHDPTAA
jgi:ketosteroid isomerase-like protein